ncbi:MAG: hypothetical protein JW940_16175, partial [Polyangiaceae bacterium]|nr:hypothetical protein [Polyangiaceae bacterium]
PPLGGSGTSGPPPSGGSGTGGLPPLGGSGGAAGAAGLSGAAGQAGAGGAGGSTGGCTGVEICNGTDNDCDGVPSAVVSVSAVTAFSATLDWTTDSATDSTLRLADALPVYPVFPDPPATLQQGLAYAPGVYHGHLSWLDAAEVSDPDDGFVVRDVRGAADARFNVVVLYPDEGATGAIGELDQLIVDEAASRGLRVALRLEYYPTGTDPFDWRESDCDDIVDHYAGYLAYFEDHPSELEYVVLNLPLDAHDIRRASHQEQRAYVAYCYDKIKDTMGGSGPVYAAIYYGYRNDLPQAPLADLVDGLALTVYPQHHPDAPFPCAGIPAASDPDSLLTCKDQFDYYVDRAWHDNQLELNPKPLVLDPAGFAPHGSYANPSQMNGVVADSAAKVRAIAAVVRQVAFDDKAEGFSYFMLLHKAEAAWGLVDRREVEDETSASTHHVVLGDLFPGTEYVVRVPSADDCEIRFETQALTATTNQRPLITVTSPSYGAEALVAPGEELTITWRDEDADDDATITLFYDTDDAGCDGIEFANGIPEDDVADEYTWTVPLGIAPGAYYVGALIDDGTNPVECDYASGRWVASDITHEVARLPGGELMTPDGVLDESAWLLATPLTFAVHGSQSDGTTATVRALWDETFLYLGFEVTDQQVESSAVDWNGDCVSAIFADERLNCRIGANTEQACGSADLALDVPSCTTLDQAADDDCGYTAEMTIPWTALGRFPLAGDTFPIDLLSVDHDEGPGLPYDDAAVHFSKISWDGDGRVDTTGRAVVLGS